MKIETEWCDETPVSRVAVAALAAEVRAAFPELELDHDIAWLDESRDQRSERLFVLTLRKDGRLAGFAPFFVHPTCLQFQLGELEFARKPVQRFHLECGPLLDGSCPPSAVVDCLLTLADKLPKDGVAFLRAVPESSALHGALYDRRGPLRTKYYVVPHGPRYLRCRIAWEGSFDRYLATLGKVSRKDLRRTLKGPEKTFGGDFRLKRYSDEASVASFLELARGISAKTYQAKLLGLGLTDDSGLVHRLTVAARRSLFLGHILFMGDEPAAFHYGFLHAGRFYMVDGGYDPKWAEAQPGMLTFLKVVQDIERHRDPVATFDYLYGDGAYKIRTSNSHTPERHYYLIKKTFSSALLAGAMIATDGISRGLGTILARYGIKDRIKRLIRRGSRA